MKMKTRILLVAGALLGLGMVTGCEKPAPGPEAATTEPAEAKQAAENAKPAVEEGKHDPEDMNWFGGPVYKGEPNLEATAALVKAGGGAEDFSFQTALVSMLGEETVQAEVKKLSEQYGEEAVGRFVGGMDFAVKDALKRAGEREIALPEPPADLEGVKLAKALVQAGVAPDGTFWSGLLFDKALSHDLHNLVMADIDAQLGRDADKETHKILNQAMYDVAQALDMKDVKLAALH